MSYEEGNAASRTLSSTSNLQGIQMLRGIAAVAVLIHHSLAESLFLTWTHTPPAWFVMVGASGVDLFFVISGFIMLYTCADRFGQERAASDFLARRLIRIVPLYWLCSLAVLALALSGHFYKSLTINSDLILSSFFFIPGTRQLVPVAWTLQYEMFFYLLFALCLSYATPARTVIFLPVMLLASLAFSNLLPHGSVQAFLGSPIVLEFGFGLALGYAFTKGMLPKISPYILGTLGCVGIVASAIALPFQYTAGLNETYRYWAWGLPALLIVYAALNVNRVEGRAGRFLSYLGDASYSIYLTHGIIMTSFARVIKTDGVGDKLHPILWVALVIIVATLIGLATHRWIERPQDTFLRQWWKSRQKKVLSARIA